MGPLTAAAAAKYGGADWGGNVLGRGGGAGRGARLLGRGRRTGGPCLLGEGGGRGGLCAGEGGTGGEISRLPGRGVYDYSVRLDVCGMGGEEVPDLPGMREGSQAHRLPLGREEVPPPPRMCRGPAMPGQPTCYPH